jgi:dihydropteroate synthase
MAILNVTPDSFYASSRLSSPAEVVEAARCAVSDGACILDIGACSTRPGSTPAPEEEEWRRLEPALEAVRSALPEVPLSVDTFRPEIARRAIEQFGQLTINDISGGGDDMFRIVRRYDVPYIWTLRGDYGLLQRLPEMADMQLVLDPGLGFCGGVEQDYACLRRLDELSACGYPVLVGASRKSMLWKLLGTSPDDCLSATQVLHLYALQHGATILRVHDVREAAQTITIYNTLYSITN